MSGSGILSNVKGLKPHLLRSHGTLAEVEDIRVDLDKTLGQLVAFTVDEFTNAAAAGAADLLAATATTVAPQTVTAFLAGGVAKLAAYPRNVTLTTAGATPADAPATAVVTGTYRGKAQTETITVAQTATIATGVKPFSTITSVAYAAADGTGATVAIGVGAGLGVGHLPKSRAGLCAPLKETAIGAYVTTGALTVDGLYTPAAAPNGTNDYAVYYEYDPAA